MSEFRCKCGWALCATQPTRIRCGMCSREYHIDADRITPVAIGLGDRIASIIDACGGRYYKRAYKRLFGKDCGCGGRQAKLNRWWNRNA